MTEKEALKRLLEMREQQKSLEIWLAAITKEHDARLKREPVKDQLEK